MPPPWIGKATRLVQLQRPRELSDRGNVRIENWVDVAEVWAEFLPATSRESYRTQQVVPELAHLVRIRRRGDVTSRWRVKWGRRVLEIAGPPREVEDRGEQLIELACIEREA